MTSSELILKSRLAAGLNQTELAARAGTSQPALSLYESGTRQPQADTLQRIVRAAGADLQLVLLGDPVVEPSAAELTRRGQILEALLRAVPAFPLEDPGAMRAPRLIDLVQPRQ